MAMLVLKNKLHGSSNDFQLEAKVMLMAAKPSVTPDTNPAFITEDLEFADISDGLITAREEEAREQQRKGLAKKAKDGEIEDRGTRINVDNDDVEGPRGGFGKRSFIATDEFRIQNPLGVGIKPEDSGSRWYQKDINTQIFRVFPGDENLATDRSGAARSEAFANQSVTASSPVRETQKFSARFRVAQHNGNNGRGTLIFQSKGSGPDRLNNTGEPGPAFGLKAEANGDITLHQRIPGAPTKITPTGFRVGDSFDFEAEDDGFTYRAKINGEVIGTGTFERGSSRTVARWGAYVDGGENGILSGGLDEPQVVYVSGARVTKSRGTVRLTAQEREDAVTAESASS